MVTSVKMRDDTKQRLDRLRESLSRLDGETVTLQDALERAIAWCSLKPELLRNSKTRVQYPLAPARIRALHAVADDWGAATSEDDIDFTLYGGRRRRRS